jgi:hypothetical protein
VNVAPAGLTAARYQGTLTAQASGYATATARVTLDVHGLLVSTSADRSSATPLGGRTVAGRTYVFTKPDSGATQVRFWFDNPTMSGTPRKVEKNAPWDFAGSDASGAAIAFDTTRVANGVHEITAAIDLVGGGTLVVSERFTVANG